MEMEKLIAIVTIILTLSVASERLVEIIKGFMPKTFGETPVKNAADATEAIRSMADPLAAADPAAPATLRLTATHETEGWRKAKISMLAIGCGLVTAFLASPVIVSLFKDLTAGSQCLRFTDSSDSPCFAIGLNGALLTVALGLLASGGSATWHSILEYLLKIKDLKKVEVKKADAMARVEIAEAKFNLKNKLDNPTP